MMGLRCGSVAKAAVLGLLIPMAVRADFVLESRNTAAKAASGVPTFSATLRWSPQQKTSLPKELKALDGPQSAMLLLPGPASSATLSTPFKSPDSPFTVKTGFVGTLPFVQIMADPGKAAGVSETTVTVEVQLTGEALPVASPEAQPLAARVASDLFLNAADLKSVPLATSATTKALPGAPGEYRITIADGLQVVRVPLADLGISEGGVASLRLTHNGNAVPVGGAIDGNLWFYMPRHTTLTANSQSVFATRNSGSPSVTITTRPAFETLTPAGVEAFVTRTRDYSEYLNLQYERASPLPLGERFVANRISAQTSATSNHQSVWDLPVTDWLDYSQPITVTATVLGHTEDPNSPNHQVNLYLEDVQLPARDAAYPTLTAVWDGRTSATVTGAVTIPAGPNPVERLRLKHYVPPALQGGQFVNIDVQMLDTASLTWVGRARVDIDGSAEVDLSSAAGPRLVTVGGLPNGSLASDVIVLDVSNPMAPVRLTSPAIGTGNGTTFVEFEAGADATRFFVVHKSSFAVPSVAPAETLPAPAAADETLTAIVVRFPAMATAAAPLAQLRTGKTIFLDPQAAYNAYSNGFQDPAALRQAIRELVEASQVRTEFPCLILFGHGSFDRPNFLNRQVGTEIPAFLYENFAELPSIEDPSDRDYAMLGDDQFDDMLVSRIPVRTPQEGTNFVSRLVAFKQRVPVLNTLPRVGVFVVDYFDGRFGSDVNTFGIPAWQNRNRKAARVDVVPTSGDEERALIRQWANSPEGGAAIIVYTGHGNTNRWAKESIFRSQDVAGGIWRAGGKDVYIQPVMPTRDWPFVISFTCLNNLYALPTGERSLGESLIAPPEAVDMNPAAGGIGALAPSSLEVFEQQAIFAYYAYLVLGSTDATKPTTQGELLLRTRNKFLLETGGIDNFERTARVYLLFGDGGTSLTLDSPFTAGTTTGLMLE